MHTVINGNDLRTAGSRTITFEGAASGAGISFFSVDSDPGQGPDLHTHPYPETWLVLEGSSVITVDGEEIRTEVDDIVVVPAETPHAFRNSGTGQLRIMCVHASPTFATEWLHQEVTS